MSLEPATGPPLSVDQVLEVLQRIPRRRFVPWPWRSQVEENVPLPIGHGQTISQPRLVAEMTHLVCPHPSGLALEIGTGSGFQAALLAELVREVHTIEIIEPLAESARKRLASLGYHNLHVHYADGYRGWPPAAPFDIIVVSAAANHVPQPLLYQLAIGGRMIIPVGPRNYQELQLIRKAADGRIKRQNVGGVAFVPFTGEAEA